MFKLSLILGAVCAIVMCAPTQPDTKTPFDPIKPLIEGVNSIKKAFVGAVTKVLKFIKKLPIIGNILPIDKLIEGLKKFEDCNLNVKWPTPAIDLLGENPIGTGASGNGSTPKVPTPEESNSEILNNSIEE